MGTILLYSTLFGTGSSAETKAAADEKAKAVSGVKSVDNALQIVRAAKQDTVAAKDDDVEDRVEAALGKQDDLKAVKIDVDVENGIARLTGMVPSQADRLRAAVLTRTASGVWAVRTACAWSRTSRRPARSREDERGRTRRFRSDA